MKSKILKFLILIFTLCSLPLFVTACDDMPSMHRHIFDRMVTSDVYRINYADCLLAERYYYSCECGKKGETWFEVGQPLGHKGGTATCKDRAVCSVCFEEYGDYEQHVYKNRQCENCGINMPSEGLEYILINDDEYEVCSIGKCEDTQIIIPSTYEGKPVTSIGCNAFYDNQNLTEVVIPASIKSINEWAFTFCDNLTKVNYLGSIDEWAQIQFNGFKANPLINAKSLYVKGQLVNHARLTSAKSISPRAFYNCVSLTSMEICTSVTNIGNDAFNGCTSLEILNYAGTIAEWNEIEKGANWNKKVTASFVQCADGKVEL